MSSSQNPLFAFPGFKINREEDSVLHTPAFSVRPIQDIIREEMEKQVEVRLGGWVRTPGTFGSPSPHRYPGLNFVPATGPAHASSSECFGERNELKKLPMALTTQTPSPKKKR